MLSCFQREQARGQTTLHLPVKSDSYQIHLDKGKISVGSHKMVEKNAGGEKSLPST